MAEERDFIDELIEFQDNWNAVQNPLGGVVDTLTTDPSKVKRWNPAEYKEQPRPNSVMCLCVASKSPDPCYRCMEVCPTDAIDVQANSVSLDGDLCRKCGLCASVCPTNTFMTTKLTARNLYDRVAKAASAYEQAYVTCTRAIGSLGRMPMGNEIVLPCVGAMPAEIWFSLLADYRNISVFLPEGICDRCRTTTGEAVYVEMIGLAEEWSGGSVGLEESEENLTHDLTRAYRRSQFVSSMASSGVNLVASTTPVISGAKAVAMRIKNHNDQLLEMQREIERVVGSKGVSAKRRVLTQRRKSVLTAIQKHPRLAETYERDVPVCDWSRCTMCGDCVSACPIHACDIDASGRFSVEPMYCISCGACMVACEEAAIKMEPCDPSAIVMPDPDADKLAERRAELAKRKAEAKEKINQGLGVIERLVDSPKE